MILPANYLLERFQNHMEIYNTLYLFIFYTLCHWLASSCTEKMKKQENNFQIRTKWRFDNEEIYRGWLITCKLASENSSYLTNMTDKQITKLNNSKILKSENFS